MKILIYHSNVTEIENLFRSGMKLPRACQIKAADNYQGFDRNLRSCLSGQGVIVFYAQEKRDLDYLKSKIAVTGDFKIIISVKDSSLYSTAFSLYPIYVQIWNRKNTDLNIISILNKMVQNRFHQESAS